MAESIAGTWASIAGIEIINDSRTFSYLKNGLGPGSVSVYGDCGCSNIIDLLDCPGITGYITPSQDDAPWYTADIPASADFLGMVVDKFEGLNSPFTRSVQQAIGNGGILTRSRLKTRELHWSGFLFGTTCCSVQYGLRWLTQTLSRFGTNCSDCFGDDLELLICCPQEGESTTGNNSPFRTLKGVALLEGPTIISERKTCTSNCSSGCGGSCILEIEFTLVATQPYFYSPEIPVVDCANLFDGAVPPYTDIDVPCGPFDCSNLVNCSSGALPPTATYVNNCIDPFITPLANYYTVPRSSWNEFDEVVPIISITTGIYQLGHIKLGFYSSSSGNPCGDLVNDPPDCDIICDSLDITAIPPLSTFYIDGRTRKMAIICNDGTAWAGERLTAGPWSWPSFNCLGFCMEVQFESNGTVNPGERVSCVSISIVPRTF